MSQQKSLFSFYSVGAAAAKNPAVSSPLVNLLEDGSNSSKRTSAAGFNRLWESRMTLDDSKAEKATPKDVLKSIQQKLAKGKTVRQEDDSSDTQAGPFIPGFKRIREAELASSASAPSTIESNEKRAKILEALGADDCSRTGGAWEAAKAKFEWMTPAKIKDGKKRRPEHPLYDARTLFIPSNVFNTFSASQKQYWATKCRYMDTLLFFKVGKFYELYELDAEIGHKELEWKLIVSGVGKCRQVGCPESGIDDAIQKLVSRGYKVGRMEQMETAAEARANGGRNMTVQRQLTQVLTPSTLVDGNIRPEAVHLLALKEEERGQNLCGTPIEEGNSSVTIGFAFVDAAAGRFYVGCIRDDSSRSALLTLLTQVAPQELLYEMGGMSEETRRALRRSSGPGWLPLVLTPLQPHVEFIEAADAMHEFRTRRFFTGGTDSDWCTKGGDSWPEALEALLERDLAISALGALGCHLIRIKCDDELLPNGILSPYELYKGSLRLDGQTVQNLELLQNRASGGREGTLLSYLDGCVTQFGKRLLRRWICHPLQNIGDIQYRLDAVDELTSCVGVSSSIRAGLRRMPDLERLVARLGGLAACPILGLVPSAARKVHQRRVKAFCSAVLGMKSAFNLLVRLKKILDEGGPLKSKFLLSASSLSDSKAIHSCLKKLESYVDESSKVPKLVFEEQNPESNEDDLEAEARTLSVLIDLFNERRFDWMEVVETLGQLDVLISFASAVSGSSGPTCRPQFVQSQGLQKGGSVLDMKGLWHPYAVGGQGGAIVPNDLQLGSCFESTIQPSTLLLTGPNMGGKSTLLRATCLAVIMAQLGCFVPCESCTLSPVDTIFTRLGASDHIMTGESTFMVECQEASSVLHHATSDSLVVLDELGRGTSTFDGYSIAYAVFHELVNNLSCRMMFATHYHPLTQEFRLNPLVRLGHMSCCFESEVDVNYAQSNHKESVLGKRLVFLYKLAEGACPKSYGLQVAKLAGLPPSIIKSAESAAEILQTRLATRVQDRQSAFPEHDQLVRAVLAATGVMRTGIEAERPDLSIWENLRRIKKLDCQS